MILLVTAIHWYFADFPSAFNPMNHLCLHCNFFNYQILKLWSWLSPESQTSFMVQQYQLNALDIKTLHHDWSSSDKAIMSSYGLTSPGWLNDNVNILFVLQLMQSITTWPYYLFSSSVIYFARYFLCQGITMGSFLTPLLQTYI